VQKRRDYRYVLSVEAPRRRGLTTPRTDLLSTREVPRAREDARARSATTEPTSRDLHNRLGRLRRSGSTSRITEPRSSAEIRPISDKTNSWRSRARSDLRRQGRVGTDLEGRLDPRSSRTPAADTQEADTKAPSMAHLLSGHLSNHGRRRDVEERNRAERRWDHEAMAGWPISTSA